MNDLINSHKKLQVEGNENHASTCRLQEIAKSDMAMSALHSNDASAEIWSRLMKRRQKPQSDGEQDLQ